ncbi:hypothetical protein [Solibacillus sp. NPDC093137]|uniref:hypothetical protein n=1 Tax=Solibacillus sp. NPDC093137 TaxID=3390678 RepID=UPI003D05583E
MTSMYLVLTFKVGAANAAASKLEENGFSKNSFISAEVMEDLTGIVYLIMGIGLLWAVAWIVIGGMLLSSSGSNPQKRSAGLGAILLACVGVYIIFKAYAIAGWATSF